MLYPLPSHLHPFFPSQPLCTAIQFVYISLNLAIRMLYPLPSHLHPFLPSQPHCTAIQFVRISLNLNIRMQYTAEISSIIDSDVVCTGK